MNGIEGKAVNPITDGTEGPDLSDVPLTIPGKNKPVSSMRAVGLNPPDRSERLARARSVLLQVEASTGVRVHCSESIQDTWMPPGVYHVPLGIEGMMHSLVQVMSSGMQVAVVGIPDVGWEAASRLGLDISRVATVPQFTEAAAKTVGILIEGFDVIALGAVDLSVATRRSLAARSRMLDRFLLTSDSWVGISRPFPASGKIEGTSAASKLSVFEGGVAV